MESALNSIEFCPSWLMRLAHSTYLQLVVLHHCPRTRKSLAVWPKQNVMQLIQDTADPKLMTSYYPCRDPQAIVPSTLVILYPLGLK